MKDCGCYNDVLTFCHVYQKTNLFSFRNSELNSVIKNNKY